MPKYTYDSEHPVVHNVEDDLHKLLLKLLIASGNKADYGKFFGKVKSTVLATTFLFNIRCTTLCCIDA